MINCTIRNHLHTLARCTQVSQADLDCISRHLGERLYGNSACTTPKARKIHKRCVAIVYAPVSLALESPCFYILRSHTVWAQRGGGFDASSVVTAVQHQLKAIALAIGWLWDNHRQWLQTRYTQKAGTPSFPPPLYTSHRLAYALGASALLTALATAVTNLWVVPQLNAHVLPAVTSTAAIALQRDVRGSCCGA